MLEDSEIDGEDLDKVVLIEKNAAGRYVMKSRFNFMLPMTLDEKEPTQIGRASCRERV